MYINSGKLYPIGYILGDISSITGKYPYFIYYINSVSSVNIYEIFK